MAKMSVTVCDICKEIGQEAAPYTIEGDGRLAHLDLCDRHAEPLLELLELGVEVKVKDDARQVRRTARYHDMVTTFEDLEELKKKS